MTNNILKKYFRSLAILAAVTPLASYATAYTPAKFGNAADTLSKQITLPASFGEGVKTVSVYCQADVLTSGNINAVTCYENSPLVSMQKTTESALKSSTFEPATIDGKAVPVRMQLRVVYSLGGTQAPIVLLPNLGTLQAQYGTYYYAPQERLDTNDWYANYTTKERGDGKLFFAEGKTTRVMANIEADGRVETVSTLEAALRKQADATSIENSLKKSKFIPGFVENKPTAMHYIAVVNYQK
ncbi:energy transducer TonB [Cellvibrio mixtus]|uniref:energy transducer TonB n=1 Tax=Cellvibrio mixtus TaxID=39650 RepID=UPI00058748B4|nr:energy transducer TonB [Cellvibrio mixtus]